MAPVNLNETTVMAVRRIGIRRVQHLRCKVQHSSKKTKQRRATFKIGCRYLKWIGTMVHHSPGMVNRRPAVCAKIGHKPRMLWKHQRMNTNQRYSHTNHRSKQVTSNSQEIMNSDTQFIVVRWSCLRPLWSWWFYWCSLDDYNLF